jgi:hypothetical protein
MSLNNLACALFSRFEQQREFGDLDESIRLHREALDLEPSPHPDRCMSLNSLASVLSTRFEQKGDPADLEQAILDFRGAAMYITGPVLRASLLHANGLPLPPPLGILRFWRHTSLVLTSFHAWLLLI